MKQFFLYAAYLLCGIFVFQTIPVKAQSETSSKDYTLAYVGDRVAGIYIFLRCEPYQKYTYIATVKVKVSWTGTIDESFEKCIKKAKRKYPSFNGMIFRNNAFSKADLIRFDDVAAGREGYEIDDFVSFTKSDEIYYGQIIQLKTQSRQVVIKHKTIYGEEELSTIYTKYVTNLSKEQYNEKLVEFQKKIDSYKFNIGDKVRWIYGNEVREGEILTLDEKYHRATVQYTSTDGTKKIQKLDYVKLTKLQ
ncbi:MAG: hypothetical protein A2W93_12195 [Bacteroidetes bacterium GWF2_43_63]|nr:MAG: hypothetical protein A2W94_15685 [Bacteroidetes bacterium GWE2_42_42]OFY56383.1 MAG: hypothetical protein A2W93_12195 [Bacteroidetes bacterium GWF2_43_63]HBG69651.1 hypothetical protein [Bacteroidales bacterium]HCB61917.1 hypothetical protein [Bacteroidales bacterium]HCY22143.1 hypothetical protein [Bacteroidales bacterium]